MWDVRQVQTIVQLQRFLAMSVTRCQEQLLTPTCF